MFFKKNRNQTLLKSHLLLQDTSYLNPTVRFINGFKDNCYLKLGDFSHIEGNVEFDISQKSIIIGNGTYIHEGASIYGEVIFGDYCLVAKNLFASSGTHLFDKPCYIRKCDKEPIAEKKCRTIKIHDDVWIGYNVYLHPGITIGKGAIVGALSAVTKDVLPYSIVGGVPAKKISTRFDYNPPGKINSEEKKHFPYFYSGFYQNDIENSVDGYLINKEIFCLAAPQSFIKGSILIKGNSRSESYLKLLNSKNNIYFKSGEFEINIPINDEKKVIESMGFKFIDIQINDIGSMCRLKEVIFLSN